MNTPIICPRLCSACILILSEWISLRITREGSLPAHRLTLLDCATVFQAKTHLCWSYFLTLLLSSLSWLSLNLKF